MNFYISVCAWYYVEMKVNHSLPKFPINFRVRKDFLETSCLYGHVFANEL